MNPESRIPNPESLREGDNGFTLIELSIVLIIISLIVGGVLVGRDLIDSANMRKDFSETEKTSAAVNTFRLKYNALPGDLPNPALFGFDAGSYGNGDKKIQLMSGWSAILVNSCPSTYRPEWMHAYYHLSEAGLIATKIGYTAACAVGMNAGVHFPLMNTNGRIGSASDESAGFKPGVLLGYEQNSRISGHYFRLGAMPMDPGTYVYTVFLAGFTPTRAKLFDQKFDDGSPLSGIIQIAPAYEQCPDDVYDTSTAACKFGGISDTSTYFHCALLSTGDYDTSSGARACALRIKAGF